MLSKVDREEDDVRRQSFSIGNITAGAVAFGDGLTITGSLVVSGEDFPSGDQDSAESVHVDSIEFGRPESDDT